MTPRVGHVILAGLLASGAARLTCAQEVELKLDAPPGQAGSKFLRPPGSDPYAPNVNWDAIPPWRQTSFYGIRAQGRVFIYVVDCSGSMADDARLARAKREIRRSVLDLSFPQRFQVIFYNDRALPMPGGGTMPADLSSKTQMLKWFNLVDAEGETDPRSAMSLALGQTPDAVFLLTDGEFPQGAAEAIAKRNPKKIPIHCIDLAGGSGASALRKIARDSGGQYAARLSR